MSVLQKDIVYAVYVDETVFWSPDESKVEETISKLKALKIELTNEGEVN